MPSAPINTRDIELIGVGLLSLTGAVVWSFAMGGSGWVPPLVFLGLGALSLVLAWWDVRTRGTPR